MTNQPPVHSDPKEAIKNILEYLVDNVQMIRARMIRGAISVDEGKAHNRRLKQEALDQLHDLYIQGQIAELKHLKCDVYTTAGNKEFGKQLTSERIASLTSQLTKKG